MCESNIMWRGNSKTTSNTVSINADDITTTTINATSGTIGTLNSTQVNTAGLNSTSGTVGTLNSTQVNTVGLNSTSGTVGTLNSTQVNAGTIVSGISYATDTYTTQLYINNQPFLYSTGNWEPTFELINSDGTGITLTYQKRDGYYIRNGNQVTVYFDLEFELTLDVGVSNVDKFAAIGNLPFEIGGPISDGKVQVTSTASAVSFPNGFAGPVPIIALPVFSAPFTYNAYETGLTVPLSVSFVSYGTWNSDGRKLLIRCNQTIYAPVLTIPPYAEAFTTDGNVSFLFFNSGIYSPGQFSGSISYAIA